MVTTAKLASLLPIPLIVLSEPAGADQTSTVKRQMWRGSVLQVACLVWNYAASCSFSFEI